jgi:hypothetical protein
MDLLMMECGKLSEGEGVSSRTDQTKSALGSGSEWFSTVNYLKY